MNTVKTLKSQEHLELSVMHAPEGQEFVPCPTLMAQGSLYSSILRGDNGHFLEFPKPSYATSSETALTSSVTAVEQQIHARFSPSSSSCMSISQAQLVHYDLNCPPVGKGVIIKQKAESHADGSSALTDAAVGDNFLASVHSVNCNGARWGSLQHQADWLSFPNQFSACQQQQKNQQMMSIASRLSIFRNPTMNKAGFGGSQQLGFSSMFEQESRPEEDTEKIAKRQRRMIKNRESAARSRAKKQAHVNQLQQRAEELIRRNENLKRWEVGRPIKT